MDLFDRKSLTDINCFLNMKNEVARKTSNFSLKGLYSFLKLSKYELSQNAAVTDPHDKRIRIYIYIYISEVEFCLGFHLGNFLQIG